MEHARLYRLEKRVGLARGKGIHLDGINAGQPGTQELGSLDRSLVVVGPHKHTRPIRDRLTA